jgi:predicted RNA-binding protein with PIN domain
VRVVYAHDSADAYIERETKAQRAEGRPVRVATSEVD